MLLPVRGIRMPAELAGQRNGLLSDTTLAATNGIPTVVLCHPAARSWRALYAAASRAGLHLTATSLYDSYRPYHIQEQVFRDRYTTDYIANTLTTVWRGQIWYLRKGKAQAATPGTSNHGWGLAVDLRITQLVLEWLVANEEDYGFSHELQTENWHVRYWAGDDIPPATIEYERSENDMYGRFLFVITDHIDTDGRPVDGVYGVGAGSTRLFMADWNNDVVPYAKRWNISLTNTAEWPRMTRATADREVGPLYGSGQWVPPAPVDGVAEHTHVPGGVA